MHRSGVLFLVALVSLLGLATAHVALTFPRARQYDLDFLDNARTPGPCGMPKGKSITLGYLHVERRAKVSSVRAILIPRQLPIETRFKVSNSALENSVVEGGHARDLESD